MHRDDRRNRLVISIDHTLTIKRARTSDSGNYFCTGGLTNVIDEWMTWSDLQKWIVESVKMKYYFHVDVVELSEDNILDVSEYSATKPKPTEELPVLNIAMETSWHSWSQCSVCGEPGLRKRIGMCMVRIIDRYKNIPHDYLNKVLRKPETRLPCQSQLLRQLFDERIFSRQNEVQIEECFELCYTTTSSERQRRAISTSEMLTGEKDKGSSQEKSITEGDYLILVCPGATLTRSPVWVNGTKNLPLMELKKSTNDRINFDPIGNLMFAPVLMSDEGTFTCWMKGELKRTFEVKVKENTKGEAMNYALYMCYVFLADFVVFVGLSVVKFMNRRVQIRKKAGKASGVGPTEVEEKASLINETGDQSDGENA